LFIGLAAADYQPTGSISTEKRHLFYPGALGYGGYGYGYPGYGGFGLGLGYAAPFGYGAGAILKKRDVYGQVDTEGYSPLTKRDVNNGYSAGEGQGQTESETEKRHLLLPGALGYGGYGVPVTGYGLGHGLGYGYGLGLGYAAPFGYGAGAILKKRSTTFENTGSFEDQRNKREVNYGYYNGEEGKGSQNEKRHLVGLGYGLGYGAGVPFGGYGLGYGYGAGLGYGLPLAGYGGFLKKREVSEQYETNFKRDLNNYGYNGQYESEFPKQKREVNYGFRTEGLTEKRHLVGLGYGAGVPFAGVPLAGVPFAGYGLGYGYGAGLGYGRLGGLFKRDVQFFEIPNPYQWDSSFKVSHAELDGQHQKLFQLIDRLDKDKSNRGALNELLAMVKLHFETEERVMRASGFLKDGHKQAHDKLLEDAGKLTTIDQAATDFLKNWLVYHIKGSDIPDYGGRV